VIAAFVITRLPFLVDWQLPLAFPDSATYLWPLEDVESGRWPLFDLRTPGYPAFWWLCRRFSPRVEFVIYAQMAMSLAVAAGAVIVMSRYARHLVMPVAIALAIFVSANSHLMWDVALLSESIFTSTIIAWAVCLLVALQTRSTGFLLLTSMTAAAAISLRPSGITLLGIMMALAVWLYRQGAAARPLAAWLAPVTLFVCGLVIYNQATIGIAGLSGGSTWAYLWSTTLYLDPDPGLLPQINEAAAAKNAAVSASDRAIIYGSGDVRQVRDAIERNIGAGIGQIADRLTGWPARTGWRYMQYRPDLQRAIRTSISRRPRVYAVNMAGTFLDNFRFIAVPHPNYYTAFPAATLYADAFLAQPFYVRNLHRYYNPSPPASVRVERDAGGVPRAVAAFSRLERFYRPFSEWRSVLFENAFWSWTIPFGAVGGLLVAIRRRHLSPGLLAWFACVAAVMGNAFMAALIGHTEPRYAQPFHVVNYLAVALAPALVRALREKP
jgi:hypothetical protein